MESWGLISICWVVLKYRGSKMTLTASYFEVVPRVCIIDPSLPLPPHLWDLWMRWIFLIFPALAFPAGPGQIGVSISDPFPGGCSSYYFLRRDLGGWPGGEISDAGHLLMKTIFFYRQVMNCFVVSIFSHFLSLDVPLLCIRCWSGQESQPG